MRSSCTSISKSGTHSPESGRSWIRSRSRDTPPTSSIFKTWAERWRQRSNMLMSNLETVDEHEEIPLDYSRTNNAALSNDDTYIHSAQHPMSLTGNVLKGDMDIVPSVPRPLPFLPHQSSAQIIDRAPATRITCGSEEGAIGKTLET